MKLTYKHTLVSCFIAYVVQAVITNFTPLLFVTFQNTYQIPIAQITALIAVNFVVQLLVGVLAPLFADRLGYRACATAAHFFAALGMLLLTILPDIMEPLAGLLIAVIIYASGSGLIEVLVSPITESCPTDNKEKAMSLLHSFYSWGYVGVVLLSTGFFALFGTQHWRTLGRLWAIIPIVNCVLFTRVPLAPLIRDGERGMTLKELLRRPVFWLLLVMMVCAGATEHAVAQWASAFAEEGLQVSKTVGDLAGSMSLAFLMGTARLLYGKFGHKIKLEAFITFGSVLGIISYVLIVFVPSPVVNLIGCALIGVAVAGMWPGTLSTAAATLRNGGTTMFALLAVAGDLGCTAGPGVVGLVSDRFGDNMKLGILAAMIFPLVMLICSLIRKKKPEI